MKKINFENIGTLRRENGSIEFSLVVFENGEVKDLKNKKYIFSEKDKGLYTKKGEKVGILIFGIPREVKNKLAYTNPQLLEIIDAINEKDNGIIGKKSLKYLDEEIRSIKFPKVKMDLEANQ